MSFSVGTNSDTAHLTPFRQMLALPFIWVILFLLIPFSVIFKISLSTAVIARPPYSGLWSFDSDGNFELLANFDNYKFFFSEDLYLRAILGSLKIALISTLITLLVAYPIALAIARSPYRYRGLILLLITMPFWTSFLIRVYSWKVLLQNQGFINNFLIWTGLSDTPLQLLYTDFAVYLGILYSYLPFMVLPIYAVLESLDDDLLDAASDLGARSFSVLYRIIIPLSLPGIIAGCALVFIPVLGEYVIPELLGGPKNIMIGRLLWQEFFNIRDWPMASTIAIIAIFFVIMPIIAFQYYYVRRLEALRS